MFARLLTMAAAFAALLIPAILVVERLDADTLQLVLVVASTFALGAAGVLMMLEGIRAPRRGRRGEAPLPGRPAPPARQATTPELPVRNQPVHQLKGAFHGHHLEGYLVAT